MPPRTRPGFTLIELIIVIAIVAVLAAIVFVSVDPARRLHAASNSRRWSDITAILDAVKHYQADNRGASPSTTVAVDTGSTTVQIIGSGASVVCGAITCGSQSVVATNCATSGLGADLRPYIKKLPIDPSTGVSVSPVNFNSRYYVNKDQYGIITIGACDSEGEGGGGTGTPPTIEVSK